MLKQNKEDAKEFAGLILKYRRLKKDIQTYYQRILDNLYPDDCIRGYYKHNASTTGRLTSDQQQVPKKNISQVKQIYITRFKEWI